MPLGETLEQAVLLSVLRTDKVGFQRHVSQLKPLYTDERCLRHRVCKLRRYLIFVLPLYTLPRCSCQPGDARSCIVGLNLMFLLVENRLAEFHSELELLTEAELAIETVAFPVRLEQYLMVGAYNQVLAAKSAMPLPAFAFFMASIVETVRASIAECAGVAYETLSLGAAQELLMLDSRADLAAFLAQHRPEWTVDGEAISFAAPVGAKSADVPSMRLISESLDYATELERIV
jgi:26S proteasome regulatory subunit N12